MKKERKKITLDQRLKKDMFFIIPLAAVITYISTVHPLIEWKFDKLPVASTIDRVSVMLICLNTLYAYFSYDSLTQVYTAYMSSLKREEKIIKVLHDWRINVQIVLIHIAYICQLIRFIYYCNYIEIIDFDKGIFLVHVIVSLIAYNIVRDADMKISKLIRKYPDRFEE